MQLIGRLVSALVTELFTILCMVKVTKEKFKINIKNVSIIWVVTLLVLVNNYLFSYAVFIKTTLSLLLISFVYSKIYKKKFLDDTGIPFLLITLFFFSEIIFSFGLLIFKIDFSIMLYNAYGQIFSNFIIGLICCLITSIKIFNRLFNKIIEIFSIKKSSMIFISIVTFMGILTDKNADFHNLTGYINNILLIIIFLFMSHSLLNEKKNKEKLAFQQEILYNYIIKYEKELIEKSKIIHDFKNQLLTIKGFISDNDKAFEYLSELEKDIKKFNVTSLKKLSNIPIGGLKGLLYYKLANIDQLKIKLSLNINKKLSSIEKIDVVTYKNIIKIIGVYLDNAIEATLKSREKILEIEIYENNNILNFIISNTHDNNIDLSKIGVAGYSTKGKDRGYGLAFVKDILNNNKNFNEKRSISNKIYTVFLSVDTNKKLHIK